MIRRRARERSRLHIDFAARLAALSKPPYDSAMNRRARVLASVIPLCVSQFAVMQLAASPALATVTQCTDTDSPGLLHRFAQQYATADVQGQYGRIVAQNPTVDSPNYDFSVAHNYLYHGSDSPYAAAQELEVGWYTGLGGTAATNVTVPHYFWTYTDDDAPHAYHETDSTATPVLGDTDVLELLDAGYDSTRHMDRWEIYWHNFVPGPNGVVYLQRSGGKPLAGGEVRGRPGTHQVQMAAPGRPAQQVLNGGSWQNWNPTNFPGTVTCEGTSVNFNPVTPYQEYEANGTIP